MAFSKRGISPPSLEFQLASGMSWLIQYINGKRIKTISAEVNHSRSTVKKYMKKASGLLIEQAQAKIIEDAFPVAMRLLKAHLEKEIENVKADKEPDMKWVERILKGMYILDSPQLKNQIQPEQGEEETTLVGLMAKQMTKKLLPTMHGEVKVLEGAVEENANKDSK